MGLTAIEGGKSNQPERGSEAWAAQMREETKQLSGNIEHDYLKLAHNLWELFDAKDASGKCWVEKWGYGHIGEYATKELGINKRIADRLRRMWEVLSECNLTSKEFEQRIIDIGRSNIRLITRPGVMTTKNSIQWLEKAEKMSFLALEDEVDIFLSGRADVMKGTLGKVESVDSDGDVIENDNFDEPVVPTAPSKSLKQLIEDKVIEQVVEPKGKSDDKEEKLHYKTFALFPDQWDTLNAALERSSELSGSKKDGQNLSLMALDFLATNEFKKASMEQTQRFFKRIEKALTVKIIVMAPKDYEVLYGYKTLDRIVNAK